MSVVTIEPLVERLRERKARLRDECDRVTGNGTRPTAVGELLTSLEDELSSLVTLGAEARPRAESQALRLQHQRLRQHIDTLDSLLETMLHFETSSDVQRASARLLLADFARELCDHLSFEEENGCLRRAAEAAPRFARRAGALLEEHATFRRRAWVIAVRATQAEEDSAAWEPVAKEFGELCDALRLHEEAESDVLHGAYRVDLGGSG